VRYDGRVARARIGHLAALLLAVAGGGAVGVAAARSVRGGVEAAYEATLGADAMAAAIRIGEARLERVRTDYHRTYRVAVRQPPVDYVELVTPFRRLVLAVEERMRLGGRSFRQQEALAVLATHGATLDLVVELTFHPQNAYVGVPAYDVMLSGGSPEVARLPRALQRVPRFGPRLEARQTSSPYPAGPFAPGHGQPVLGGTLIASFDEAQLDRQGSYAVVVTEMGKPLAKAVVALASVR